MRPDYCPVANEPCQCVCLDGCRIKNNSRKPLTDEQKDAARYQYIKTMAGAMSVRIDGNHVWRMNLIGISGPSLDEAIDSAIEAAHGIQKGEA